MIWLAVSAVMAVALAGCLRVRRYSRTNVAVCLTAGGRGLYVSRTADGLWWRVRLRRGCPPPRCGDIPEGPDGAEMREPRRPTGPGPRIGAIRLEPPA
jgi:hypothetical protein